VRAKTIVAISSNFKSANMNRRESLSVIAAAAVAPLVSRAQAQTSKPAGTPVAVSDAMQQYRDRLDKATPQSVMDWMKAGNERFRTGRSSQGEQANDARARVALTGTGQRGLAVVVSCIDSRVSPELLLDAGIGDLYTVRLGANVVGEDALGSIEVAVASDAKIVLLLGHTRCAGVRAACSNMELEHFTQLLNKVRPAIGKANIFLDNDKSKAQEIGERIPANPRYISFVSQQNARWQAEQVLARSQTVRDAVTKGDAWLVPALYDVETGGIAFDAPLKVTKPA
jgi:carbonic anhydrase